MSCEPQVLVQGEDFSIAQCKGCKRIGLHYKNILAGFDQREFQCFAQGFCALSFEANCVPFPGSVEHIVIKTCHDNIQFTFKEQEFFHMKELLQRSCMMLEVNHILE